MRGESEMAKYYSEKQIEKAREMNLLTYLQTYEPTELVHIATHVNTKCVHNHMVINSVSFKDGMKFHDCRDTYRLLRQTSDRICREHGLSTVDRPKGKGVSQYVYKMEQAGMPTRYNVARQAIDEAVAVSLTIEEFKSELRMSRGITLTEEQAMKMTKALVDRYRTRANQEHAAPAPMRDDMAR